MIDAREVIPAAPVAVEHRIAQTAKQDVIGRAILRVQLQAVALELLGLEGLALDLFLVLRAGWEAKHWQPTVLLPESADAPGDAVASLGETALIAGWSGMRGRREQQARGQRQAE
jgi:hypothetical protein